MTFREKNRNYRKENRMRPHRRGYEDVTRDSECFERTPKHIGAERMRPGTTERLNRFQSPGFEDVRENRRRKARFHRHSNSMHGTMQDTHKFGERHSDHRPRATTCELLHERQRLERRMDFLRSRLHRINHRLHRRFAHHRRMAEN